jgi:alpha/beta superfamily hydrolase
MTPTSPSQIKSIDDLRGSAGRLEALLNTGRDDAPYAALVCHPHPEGGGTMHNKVVYHAMKAFSSFGLPVLRFNFRSVGLSEGLHDEGIGEQEDVQAALDWMERNLSRPMLFAGFSFGSNVGLRACCGDPRVEITAMAFCQSARCRSCLSVAITMSTGRVT